jgi:hypothetical protein
MGETCSQLVITIVATTKAITVSKALTLIFVFLIPLEAFAVSFAQEVFTVAQFPSTSPPRV